MLSPNTRKYGPEKTPYFDTFHAYMPRKSWKIAALHGTQIFYYTALVTQPYIIEELLCPCSCCKSRIMSLNAAITNL